MLNVGFITENHFPRLGGMEYATHFLVEGLNKIDSVTASVACSTLRGVPKDFNYSYPCYRAKSLSFLTPWLHELNRQSFVKKEQINVLHGQMLHGGGYLAMELSKKFNKPFVAQSHGADVQLVPEINYGALNDDEKRKKIKEVIQSANKLIAVSSMNKENLIDLGAKPEQVEIIHNGINISKISTTPAKNVRPYWNISDDDFVLITVGRNRPIKRMELLFQALAKLKDKKHIKCICVGPKANLQELAVSYDVLDKIVLVGQVPKDQNLSLNPPHEELINLYRSADLYVSTSYVESFGSATAEALACGTPVIICKSHGVRDVIAPEKSGWILEKETPDYLANLILSLYENREVVREQRIFTKESVSHLTWDKTAELSANVYKSLT